MSQGGGVRYRSSGVFGFREPGKGWAGGRVIGVLKSCRGDRGLRMTTRRVYRDTLSRVKSPCLQAVAPYGKRLARIGRRQRGGLDCPRVIRNAVWCGAEKPG